MEIVDELLTPGCPNCAVKHLCTAIALMATLRQGPEAQDDAVTEATQPMHPEARILLAQAYVNLVETAEGYRSHSLFAIGLLNMAEAKLAMAGDADAMSRVRTVRVSLMAGDPVGTVLTVLGGMLTRRSLWEAHHREAVRELPDFDWNGTAVRCGGAPVHEYFIQCVDDIRMEYFGAPETPEKGGKEDMATKKPAFLDKKNAKKDPKAAKAACKGGCSKKGCKK